MRLSITARLFAICLLAALPQAAQAQSEERGLYGEEDAPADTRAMPPVDYSGTARQSTIGRDPNMPPPPAPGAVMRAQPAPGDTPRLPPVFDQVTAPPLPADAQPQEPAVYDPCGEHADYPDSYALCRDRMMKIERMRDAQQRRRGTPPAPAPAAAAPAGGFAPVKEPTLEETAQQTAERLRELEEEIRKKEEEQEAAKKAPTTKKGIGEFNRNPDKGDSLFRK